ncbi:Uncharacterised protein [Bordetella ansorpii]|uniref:DUF3318 domain-containing protein n=1 Tax=Bordetella ansorpii TaxID=288768 RepID=A0A157S5K4_9BORD|nr:hypothetical protein [Bordetella ansorpii]SAI65690.1 Uncharacterised protein [Bordetella ansorpii]
MARITPAVERQVRIEMLRARAALERETLAQRLIETGHDLAPSNLIRGLLPSSLAGLVSGGGAKTGASMLWQAVSLARRYPIVSSTLSSVLLGGGKRRGLLKVAGAGLAGWQLFKAWRASKQDDEAGQAHAPAAARHPARHAK